MNFYDEILKKHSSCLEEQIIVANTYEKISYNSIERTLRNTWISPVFRSMLREIADHKAP